MPRLSKIMIILLVALLAGCEDADIERARQARLEQLQREAIAQQAQRDRREFWVVLVGVTGSVGIVCLFVGVGMGSVTRRPNAGPKQ